MPIPSLLTPYTRRNFFYLRCAMDADLKILRHYLTLSLPARTAQDADCRSELNSAFDSLSERLEKLERRTADRCPCDSGHPERCSDAGLR